MTDEAPKKPGPKSRYNPDFHPQDLIDKMGTGMIDVEIYAEWDICKDTFCEWKNRHPELKEAYKLGLAKWRKAWYAKGREFMEKGNREAYKYWAHILGLKGDKSEDKEEKTGTNITFNQLNQVNLDAKSEDELKQILEDKLKNLRIPLLNTNINKDSLDVEFKEIDDDK